MAQDRKGRGLNMYPPGKVIFMRPLKVLKRGREGGDSYRKKWDAVWVSPREVIGEGILVSKRVSGGRGFAWKRVGVFSNPGGGQRALWVSPCKGCLSD